MRVADGQYALMETMQRKSSPKILNDKILWEWLSFDPNEGASTTKIFQKYIWKNSYCHDLLAELILARTPGHPVRQRIATGHYKHLLPCLALSVIILTGRTKRNNMQLNDAKSNGFRLPNVSFDRSIWFLHVTHFLCLHVPYLYRVLQRGGVYVGDLVHGIFNLPLDLFSSGLLMSNTKNLMIASLISSCSE